MTKEAKRNEGQREPIEREQTGPEESTGEVPELSPSEAETQEIRPSAGGVTEAGEALPAAEELEALQKKAAEYDQLMDRLKRVTADYLNSQKRLEREMKERCNYAIETFALELLPVADDLARAITAAREHNGVEKILEGLELVEKQLYAVLERHGITPVETEHGAEFDPEVHEAVSVIETDEHEPNRVVQELQRGFRIHRRLLRPARVVVSAEPKREPQAKSQEPS